MVTKNYQFTMASSDDSYASDEASSDETTTRLPNDDSEEPPRRISPRKMAQKRARLTSPERVSLPSNLRSISAHQNALKKRLYGEAVTESLSLRVVCAALQLQREYLEQKRKLGAKKRRKLPPAAVRERICKLFRLSSPTYSTIISNYFKTNRNAYESRRAGNTREKLSRIPRTNKVRLEVREYVREQRMERKRVTARQVVDFLIEKQYLAIPMDDTGVYMEKKALSAALRATQRWLFDYGGYKRGPRTGNLVPSEEHTAMKHHYLRVFFENRGKEPEDRLREVYTDESYIHEHYNRNDDSIWDPNDEQDVKYSKDKHKGRRYCFCCAIQGPNPRVAQAILAKDEAGIVSGSVWAFCPQKKKDHQGDYHKLFNGENYVKWFKEQLLPNLHQRSLIILDNAKYHLVYGPHVPVVSKMKKAECQEYLTSKGVNFEQTMTVQELKVLIRHYIKEREEIEVRKLAKENGHEVLFTPPYHSDLQPIELTWARIKGNIGRCYSNETTLSIVYDRLMAEFAALEENGSKFVNGVIEKCAKLSRRFYDQIQQEEDLDDGSDDDDDSYSDVEDVNGSDQDDQDGLEAPIEAVAV